MSRRATNKTPRRTPSSDPSEKDILRHICLRDVPSDGKKIGVSSTANQDSVVFVYGSKLDSPEQLIYASFKQAAKFGSFKKYLHRFLIPCYGRKWGQNGITYIYNGKSDYTILDEEGVQEVNGNDKEVTEKEVVNSPTQGERQGYADQPMNLAILLDEQLTSLLNSVSENVDNARSIDILGTTPDIEAESSSLQPVYYVTKWVDYSGKYGLGYQLADESVGVIFNDDSRLMIDRELKNIIYAERNGVKKYFTNKTAPANMHKKMTLLKYFIEYMRGQLLQAANHKPEPGSDLSCPPILNNWFRSKVAIVLGLSNGTVQLNFFDEPLKIILCPKVQACTLIGEDRLMHTYSFESLAQHGCSKSLFSRLRYAKASLEHLVLK